MKLSPVILQKRNPQQRRRGILEQLQLKGEVSVEQLANLLETSEVTIRKDLTALEQSGLLLRRFGGAVPMPSEAIQPSSSEISKRKLSMAQSAAALIKDHQRIVIDCGTTTQALLPVFERFRGLVVMTNSLELANQLLELENEPTTLVTGGTWDPQSQSLQGAMAEKMLTAYDFDLAFIGAAGIDVERGTTTFNELTSLSKSMARVARKTVVLAEADKLERKIPNLELAWADIDVLISDDRLDITAKEQIEYHGVDVYLAPQQHHGD